MDGTDLCDFDDKSVNVGIYVTFMSQDDCVQIITLQ